MKALSPLPIAPPIGVHYLKIEIKKGRESQIEISKKEIQEKKGAEKKSCKNIAHFA